MKSETRKAAGGIETVTIPQKKLLSSPQEWDFGEIVPAHCRIAILVEYMRSVPNIVAHPRYWTLNSGYTTRGSRLLDQGFDLSLPWLSYYKKVYSPFREQNIKVCAAIIKRIKARRDELSAFLADAISATGHEVLWSYKASSQDALTTLVAAFNAILNRDAIYNEPRFTGIPLARETRELINSQPTGPETALLNRMLLEDAFQEQIWPEPRKPIINWKKIEPRTGESTRILPMRNFAKQILDVCKKGFRLEDAFEAYALDKAYYVCLTDRPGRAGLKEEMISWVSSMERPPARPGKASSIPFHYLKWLAAWRLNDARKKQEVSFAILQKALKNYQPPPPTADPNGVLPRFGTRRGWNHAVHQAQKLLNQLAVNPWAFEAQLFASSESTLA
jgi:hypothetical protein